MNIKNRKVLILAPHTDDGELGAGGTISKLIEEGADVHYLALSAAENSVPSNFHPNILREEVARATNKLGIKDENLIVLDYCVRELEYSRQKVLDDLIHFKKLINPDLVLMPSMNDIHQDHYTVAREGLRAFKNTTILGYELIWNNLNFNTTCFIKLEECHVINKYKALCEYKSQANRSYMSEEFIRGLAKIRGVQIGAEFAECFEVVRWVI
jgi:LmbE family N-acetylglucosaminyl deacetylase